MAEPFVERFKKVAMNIQFVWFLGHFMTVVQSIFCAITWGSWNYYKAFYGTLLSYAIVLYRTYGNAQNTQELWTRVVRDENAQYFLLAIVWATAPPVRVALVPYACFSLLHSLGYIRSELIPKLFPGETLPISRTIASQINGIITKLEPHSSTLVAQVEVWGILPMSIISVFWGGTSIFTPFLYQQFLQFRYLASPLTKQVFATTEVVLDKYLLAPNIPPQVSSGYTTVKGLIKKYCDLEARARETAARQ